MGDVGSSELVKTESVSPISIQDLQSFLQESFDRKEGDVVQHSVLDTYWEKFLNDFEGIGNVTNQIAEIYQRDTIDILDEGCGSSLTLFQVVEDTEKKSKKGAIVNGYGITSSVNFLNKGVESEAMKEKVLEGITDEEELKRLRLLLDGVQHNEELGFHRYAPDGSLIKITKNDLHFLSRAFSGQKFDLIYSSSTYSHLALPWVAFIQSCEALKKGGLLLIDAIPSQEIVDERGNLVPIEEYQKYLQENNPNYRFLFIHSSDNPFVIKLVVEKLDENGLKTGLYIGDTSHQTGIKNPITIFSKTEKPGFVSPEELK